MAKDELLSQDEIDTLLDGVSSGEIPSGDSAHVSAEVQAFDFARREQLLMGRMVRLNLVRQLFVESFQVRLEQMFHAEMHVAQEPPVNRLFEDYLQSLSNPTQINICEISSPPGTRCLLVIDPVLLYMMVDQYFGGNGQPPGLTELQEFTPIELHIADQVAAIALAEFQSAWTTIFPLTFTLQETCTNPDKAQVIEADELLLQHDYTVSFGDASGTIQFVMPCSFLEPLSAILSGKPVAEDAEIDEHWRQDLEASVNASEISLNTAISTTSVTLSQLLHISAGMILPISMQDHAVLLVDNLPVLKGEFGAVEGHNAVKVSDSYCEDGCHSGTGGRKV